MLMNINIESSVPVYVQIENQVRFAIASGALKAGNQLPPVMELAKQLKLNFNTVTKAYRELEIMGYIFARRGTGFFVAKDNETRCKEDCRRDIVGRLFEVAAEGKAAGFSVADLKDTLHQCLSVNAIPYSELPEGIGMGGKKIVKK